MRRLVWVEPQVRPRSQRGLRLRLAIAAHGAIGKDAAVREHRERRIERMERQPAGRQRIQRARFERKAGAAILHEYAGRGQYDAGAEFPIERLDVGNDEPGRVGGAHPHRVPFTIRGRPVRGLAAIDLERLAVEKPAVEIAVDRLLDAIGIGHGAVAHGEGALGRLDQAVHMIEAV